MYQPSQLKKLSMIFRNELPRPTKMKKANDTPRCQHRRFKTSWTWNYPEKT